MSIIVVPDRSLYSIDPTTQSRVPLSQFDTGGGGGNAPVAAPLPSAIAAVIGSSGNYADQNHQHPFSTPASVFSMYEDFATGTVSGSYGWQSTPTGTGAATTLTSTAGSDASHTGIVQLTTGTTSTGKTTLQSYVGTGGALFTLSSVSAIAHEWCVQIPILSTTGVEQFVFRFGLMDGSAAGDAANGIYFEYDASVSATLRFCSASASSRTKVDTGITVTAGAWLRGTWTKDEGSAIYTPYVGGVAGPTINTNIPSVLVGPTTKLEKSVGTTARTALVDWFGHVQTYSTPRAA